MLSKQSHKLLKPSQARSMITYKQASCLTPESIDEMISYMDTQQPRYSLIYFHASWNPIVPKIEKDYFEFVK